MCRGRDARCSGSFMCPTHGEVITVLAKSGILSPLPSLHQGITPAILPLLTLFWLLATFDANHFPDLPQSLVVDCLERNRLHQNVRHVEKAINLARSRLSCNYISYRPGRASVRRSRSWRRSELPLLRETVVRPSRPPPPLLSPLALVLSPLCPSRLLRRCPLCLPVEC